MVVVRLATPMLCAALAASFSACSGADGQEVLGPPSTSSSGGAPNGGGGSPGGSSPALPGTGTDGPIEPGDKPPACVRESEPNGDRDDANTLVASRCGEVTSSDRIDTLTFILPEGTHSMSLDFKGQVRLEVSVDGHDTVELRGSKKGKIPFVVGEPYFVVIRADGKAPQSWQVDLVTM